MAEQQASELAPFRTACKSYDVALTHRPPQSLTMQAQGVRQPKQGPADCAEAGNQQAHQVCVAGRRVRLMISMVQQQHPPALLFCLAHPNRCLHPLSGCDVDPATTYTFSPHSYQWSVEVCGKFAACVVQPLGRNERDLHRLPFFMLTGPRLCLLFPLKTNSSSAQWPSLLSSGRWHGSALRT